MGKVEAKVVVADVDRSSIPGEESGQQTHK